MPDYPRDMEIDKDTLNVFLDDTGDMSVIGGRDNLEQSVAILVRGVTQQFIGEKITGDKVGLLEERTRRAINNDPQVDEIIDARVTEFNRATDTITMEFDTVENESFTLPISV